MAGGGFRFEGASAGQRCLEPRHILSSLFQLLRFWRVHYQPGDQSCISLEKGGFFFCTTSSKLVLRMIY